MRAEFRAELFPLPVPWWHHRCLGSHWCTCVPSPWQLSSRPLGDGTHRWGRFLHNRAYTCTHLIKKKKKKEERFWGQINHTTWSLGWEPLMRYRAHRNRPSQTPFLLASTRVNGFQISGCLSDSFCVSRFVFVILQLLSLLHQFHLLRWPL